MGFVKRNWDKVAIAGAAVVGAPMAAFAEGSLTLPTLPTDDLYTAGTAVLGLIAIGVIIGMVARALRKAG